MAKSKKAQLPVLDAHEVARRLKMGSAMFAAFADEIEHSTNIEQSTTARFKAMALNQSENVDAAIACLNELRSNINRSLELAETFSTAAARMKRALSTAEVQIQIAVKENHDIPFNGETGSFKIVNQGGSPALAGPVVDALKDFHLGNVIDPGVAFELGIPEEFLSIHEVSLLKFNKQAVKDAIDEGAEFTFARIGERGQKLSYPAIKIGVMKLTEVATDAAADEVTNAGE